MSIAPHVGTGSWICWECVDYNLDTDFTCAYCGISRYSFSQWLHEVDWELQDRGTSRDELPYQLHLWFEIWNARIEPGDAVVVALASYKSIGLANPVSIM